MTPDHLHLARAPSKSPDRQLAFRASSSYPEPFEFAGRGNAGWRSLVKMPILGLIEAILTSRDIATPGTLFTNSDERILQDPGMPTGEDSYPLRPLEDAASLHISAMIAMSRWTGQIGAFIQRRDDQDAASPPGSLPSAARFLPESVPSRLGRQRHRRRRFDVLKDAWNTRFRRTR
jgi:hypothetical protein